MLVSPHATGARYTLYLLNLGALGKPGAAWFAAQADFASLVSGANSSSALPLPGVERCV